MRSLFVLCAVLLAAVLSFHSTSAITVHLVPHTHDDVGWQVTVDQYYIGSVQYIITTVIEQLLVNPDRKFIYVEQAYFQRWWREQTDTVKDQVKQLVASGQLEMINGGWCMHDEASTHYIDMVDQTTYGHRFITEQFGVQPKIGWQIDPFGHSATQAALLSAEAGFEALFFGRIDYQDYNARAQTKRLEWIWQASASLGSDASLFAGQFWNGYGPPGGFNFDIGSNDPPVQDDPRLTDYNVDQRVEDFVQRAMEQSKIFAGENLMWTMGSDFQYSAAHTYFTNLDKLIKAVNADGRVKAMYSTPSIYVEAKYAEGLTLTTKTDDIFPYADGPDAYWTGYFTSRAALKRYVRVQSAFLQVARHLELFNGGNGTATEALWEALGVAQHHDGVSGTAKQAVTYDYAKRLSVGGASSDAAIQNGLATLLTKASSTDKPAFAYCPLANVSVCAASSAAANLVVALYNPLARSRTELVRIPVSGAGYSVLDATGAATTSEVVALPKANPAWTSDSLPYELRFLATVPGLGIQTYFIQSASNATEKVEDVAVEQTNNKVSALKKFASAVSENKHSRHLNSIDSLKTKIDQAATTAAPAASSIQNDIWRISFGSNGLTATITELATGTTTSFVQNFFWYHSFQQDGQQNSGAYIFRPANITDPGTPVATYATLSVVTGNGVTQEAQQTFAPWLTQVIRLINGSSEVQFEYTVGPIPVDDGQGKEIISRYTTDIASNGTWFTDSNGREWQRRVRNFRPTWTWNPTQPVAGNYYPVNTGIALADQSGGLGLSILNDRSQGGASLNDGELELMLHRRLTMDDGRGVGEPLSEPGLDGKGLITTGVHYVQLGKYDDMLVKNTRTLQQRVYSPLHWSLAPLSGTVQQYLSSHNTQFTFLQTPLPYQVELMTAYAQADGSVLVRLAHNFGVDEFESNYASVSVDLATLFVVSPKSVVEKSLTNNQTPADIENKKLHWNVNATMGATAMNKRVKVPLANTTVTIGPMEVRTFVLTF